MKRRQKMEYREQLEYIKEHGKNGEVERRTRKHKKEKKKNLQGHRGLSSRMY